MGDTIVTDIIYTLVYVALLAFFFFRHQRRNEGRWGVGSWILFSYILYPIIGAFWFFIPNNIYGDIEPLRLFPFIYLALMEMVALHPVLQYDRNNIQKIEPPTMVFLNIFAIIYIICALVQIPHIITHLTDGLSSILMDSDAGAEMYHESQTEDSSYDGAINNLTSVIFNIFSPLAFILFFYYLTLEKRHRWAELGFGICIVIRTFYSLSDGQRTGVTMAVINIIVAYLALKPILSYRVQRFVRKILIILGIAIAIPFIALSVSRFGENEGGLLGGLVYYVGEAPYYFNDYALDADGTRHGDRTCNMFKKLIGMHSPNGIFDVRNAYPDMQMDDSVFSTFIGDFVLDFGPIWTAILFILFSILFTRMTRANGPNQIPFHHLILVYFAMSVCMQGGFYLFSYSFDANLQILAVVVFYCLFGLDYMLRHKQSAIITL